MSADHALVAFAVDTTGDERFDLTIRVVETGEVLDTSVTDIGYGCELSRDGRFVFYTRLDEAWRPHQLWRHRVGGDPAQDVLVHQEDDERFWMGVSTSRDERWLILGLGSKTTSEVHLLDNDDPEGEWRVVAPRRDGVEYDVEPAGDRLLVVHNTDTPDADLAWAPLDATSHEQWVPWLRSGPGERFVGVDAFDAASVLSLRTDGLTALRVLPRDPSSPSGHGEAWDVAVDQGVHSIGLGDNPEPGQTALQVVVESWATPGPCSTSTWTAVTAPCSSGCRCSATSTSANYTEQRVWATASDGTRIPVSLVHRVEVVPDGTNPARADRLRLVRDLVRPLLLGGPAQPARPRCRRRRRPRARWRGDGAALVRRRQAAREDEHLHRHPRLRRSTSSPRDGRPPTAWASKVVLREGCSSARCSTSLPRPSGWPTRPCRSWTP